MGTIASIIAPGARMVLGYAERLMAGVTPQMGARFARVGDTVIKSNHPAFVFGHLALYPVRVGQFLKLPSEAMAAPAHYEALFKPSVECKDDAEGTIYPPLDELRQVFQKTSQAAIAALESAPDEPFTQPNPVEGRMKELFPTIGAALNFYLIGHVQVHLGQISAWRRAMGLPPI